MQLLLYKTLWGHSGTFEQACLQAVEEGFSGIEGPAPLDAVEQQHWRELLEHYQLDYIAEICTAGSYVPDRCASLLQHLDSLQQRLEASLALSPRFITCLGGCDAWEESRSCEFFLRAMAMAERYGVTISFETHRGRSLFNPWVTERICRQLPALKLTCDFSHWCVVCERLLEGEEEVLESIFPRAFHIHARIGYDQGPQVPDPSAARYQPARIKHERWWQQIWMRKFERGEQSITMTPEFGPDGYQAIDVATDQPVGDLWQMNCWIAEQQRQQFAACRKTLFNKPFSG